MMLYATLVVCLSIVWAVIIWLEYRINRLQDRIEALEQGNNRMDKE